MPSQLQTELAAVGVAQVMVFLKDPDAPTAKGVGSALKAHFKLDVNAPLMAMAAARAESLAGAAAPKKPPAMRVYPRLGVMLGTVDKAGLAALKADKRVGAVSGAPIVSLIRPHKTDPTATLATARTWGLDALKAPDLWAKGFTGKGVLVGHLDTGVDGTHPALKPAIQAFAEFDDLGNAVTPTPAAHDSAQHGTHTAGTIAGRMVGGQSFGVAPEARLASAIVIEGGDVIARILGGMEWALEQGVRILSMSLGLRGFFSEFLRLTQRLRTLNVLPVFAVGNEGPGTSRSPGNYPEALSVGAHDAAKAVAAFSSSQRFTRPKDPLVPDLVAPGVGVISAKPGGGVQSMDGTSMATPHVAGLAALLMQAKPAATAAAVEAAIFKSCTLPATMPAARANRGFPDAVAALAAL